MCSERVWRRVEVTPLSVARHTGTVSTEAAELSSLTTDVTDVLDRVTALAEQLAGEGGGDGANELFEAERSLQAALRRMEAALRAIG